MKSSGSEAVQDQQTFTVRDIDLGSLQAFEPLWNKSGII